ncbi:hypothetical protein [Sphingomicrobium sediminis]|uniref:Uncharacterized protein n=1 Tax=Sphingomicrobium sediminis TaxID=2950949 RepID=A0A9X2EFP1_9SPHN|nr:hypothetical protein [Sphingomicrobium sediminis]MCM8556685.1 hypothetical protein [Sphingomicrobium sediminis]
MAKSNRVYFAQRAAEELERAKSAASPDIAEVHRTLSRRYLERASIGDRPGQDQSEEGLFGDNRASFAKVTSDA